MGPRVLDVGLWRGFKFPGVRHCFVLALYKAEQLLANRFRGVSGSRVRFVEANIGYVVESNGGVVLCRRRGQVHQRLQDMPFAQWFSRMYLDSPELEGGKGTMSSKEMKVSESLVS